jgi:hypothetical protein
MLTPSTPIAKWYKQDRIWEPFTRINDCYYEWLPYKDDSILDLPEGWRSLVVRKDVEKRVTYVHESLSNSDLRLDPDEIFVHPVPIRSQYNQTDPWKWSPHLHGRVHMVEVNLGELVWQVRGLAAITHRITAKVQWCGAMYGTRFEPEELAQFEGKFCELIGVVRYMDRVPEEVRENFF